MQRRLLIILLNKGITLNTLHSSTVTAHMVPRRWADKPESALAFLVGLGSIIVAVSVCGIRDFQLDGGAVWSAVRSFLSVAPTLFGVFAVLFCLAFVLRERKPALAEWLASAACMPLMLPLVAVIAVLKTEDIAGAGISIGALMVWGGLTSYVGVKLLMFAGQQFGHFRAARK